MPRAHFIHRVFVDWNAVPHDSFARSIPALASLPLDLTSNVTFFTGENGSGKSTLLEAMAVAYGLNPEGGSRNYHFATNDTHGSLHEATHLMRSSDHPWGAYFLRAESFYNVATAAEGYESRYLGPHADELLSGAHLSTGTTLSQARQLLGRSLHELSHGEAFLATIQEDFHENGLYFLDEPEAALSVSRRLTLLYELYQLAQHGAQLIVATHSPIVLALPGAQILRFDEEGIDEITYEETEAYQTMSLFMADYQQLLARLLDE